MKIIEYHKIPGPFKRHVEGPDKNKVIPWSWTSPELQVLADIPWQFTEKVDGTNIRVIWDGHKPEFRGRTDRALLPADLLKALIEMFPEEVLEQTFTHDSVILFGEGYGPGIQKGGGNYREDKSFILFDVKIGEWWLLRKDVEDIAKALGIDVVPLVSEKTLTEAIIDMAEIPFYSRIPKIAPRGEEKPLFIGEGIVGTPGVPLFNRKGDRIIVKLKGCDLYELEVGY